MDHPKLIYILGSGAIGSIFGARLSEKYPVILIGRKNTVNSINRHGLKLKGLINKTYKLKAQEKITNIPQSTIIFLTTKVNDSRSALLHIKNLVKRDTVLVILQNGVNQEEEYKKILKCHVIRAVSQCGASSSEPGLIRFNGDSTTFVEKNGMEIAKILINVGFKAELVDNIKIKEWEKLIVNCVINGLGSILRVKNNQLADPGLKELKTDLINECLAVSKANGIIFTKNISKMIDDYIPLSANTNSTLQDLNRGKKTEIDYLNGEIVKLGKKYGINTPVNKTLYYLIKSLETNN
ncbi:hypothetical protein A3C23_02070 [Candidatus Roizmanbacteria bacterium RIFCSPHIGHO2_02_FULL_37_13b]|uniref:2-dehydropantoate 2-reductase n=1 Tax=Candidatus Roizmanbacteria bacterium RIFCSPLOWO2_02_FULL_36_11 TaxID=1802071 RepID=A0A1F7JGP2_9BACT|nr:MAG: hypothetical protein A3C23_02070 [Candidatus Roizmanbacteria bacterium RIFCSPHIGHO2_02_FULL_37_13b]OGK54781.1 MAG: hypothetical protein A3H78_05860 [Candidatus Roizmanbacteria bacterium RIFCSPLOWO2_02_FULL_36_11]